MSLPLGLPLGLSHNRRRMRLFDHHLQKSMLVALVIMETAVVSVAIYFLYRALAASIDEQMYRVHFQASVDMLSRLVSEGLPVLAAMLLVNFVALIIADRIWVFYVRGILAQLGAVMQAAVRLDLAPLPPSPFGHAVLEQAEHWRAAEAARLDGVRARIRALPAALPEGLQARALLAHNLGAIHGD